MDWKLILQLSLFGLALAATIPIGLVSWWLAYRSDWFQIKIVFP